MGKKATALPLAELLDLEEEYTAFVGSPTGAKIARPGRSVKQLAAKMGAVLGTLRKRGDTALEKLPVLKKREDTGLGRVLRKMESGKLSPAKKTKAKV
jgi:hypothetical protein